MTINLPVISKTTAMGYLVAIGGAAAFVAKTDSLPANVRTVAGVVGSICGVLVIYTGHTQKDAGSQLAVTPDSPNPKLVPSVEVPVDPKAVPITDAANFPATKN